MAFDTLSLSAGYDRPYQFNSSMREARTIHLYKHLNLKTCIWTFETYHDMTELIDVCGGSVTADFQVPEVTSILDGWEDIASVPKPLLSGTPAIIPCACYI